MKKLTILILAAVLLISACGRDRDTAETAAPAVSPVTEAETGRQDGECFEGFILLEGMEETVKYEHIRNDAIGIGMDYDYEHLVRRSEPDREYFISCWDAPQSPAYTLEVTYNPEAPETVAAAIGEALSKEYEIGRDDSFMLTLAGGCIRLDASAEKGGMRMPNDLQTVYIIPASDGCRVAVQHCAIEGAEGFGARFRKMMDTLSVIDRKAE